MKIEGGGLPWSAEDAREVRGVRQAITTRLDGTTVNPATAPMMGELLQRLEALEAPARPDALVLPEAPGGGEPSLAETAAELEGLQGQLRAQLLTLPEGQTRGTLQSMTEVIENYLSMRGEILARVVSSTTSA